MRVKNIVVKICRPFLFYILCLGFIAILSRLSFAEQKGADPRYIFYKGNSLYEEAKYDEAITQYRRLLDEGFESGNLYYNLGNCYFKKGGLGKAILNYERARRFIPRDKDLKSNYEYVKSLVKNNVPEVKRKLLIRLVVNFFDRLTIGEIAALLSIIYVLVILIIIATIYLKISKRYSVTAVSILIISFVLSFASLKGKIAHLNKEAIIIKESVDAKFEPLESGTVHYTLYEGMKVYLLLSEDGWYKVRRSDGKIGWIEKSALEIM
ncbi:MAG: hypothetical protein ACE5IT_01370 [bacterium]